MGSTVRRIPAEPAVSRWARAMTSTFSAARCGSGRRPSATVARSSSTPLRLAAPTSPTASRNVAAPGSEQLNVTVDVDDQTSPSSNPVRSTSTS